MGKIEKTFWWLCFILAIYTTIGFKVVPDIIQEQIVKNLDENLTQKTTIEKVDFNPFTLNTKIHNFKLGELSSPLVSFEMLNADIAFLRSIFEQHASIEEVQLKKLFINIVEEKDGSINLTKLVKPSENKAEEIPKDNSSSGIKFLVSKILLENANINFTKDKENNPYKLNIKDLNYTLYDLGTYNDSLSSNDLNLKINENTNLSLTGAFRLEPFVMYGKAKISDLRIKELLDYQKDLFNFDIDAKSNINLDLDYNINLKDTTDIKLSSTLFEINKINLLNNNNSIASLDKLNIGNFLFDLSNQKINLKNSDINKLSINMIQDKNGLNFSNLVNSSTETKTEEKEEIKSDSKPWIISLNDTKLNNSNFVFNDKVNSLQIETKNFNTKTNNININGSDISLDSLNLTNPKISFVSKKDNLQIETKNTNIKLSSLGIKDGLINIKSLNLSDDNIALNEKKSKLDIDITKLNLLLSSLNIDGSKITIDSSKLKTSNIGFQDLTSKLKINTSNSNIDINSLNINGSKIDIPTISLNAPSISLNDSVNKMDIAIKNTAVNLKSFSLNNSDILIKTIKLSKPDISFSDKTNNLSVKTKDLEVFINSLSQDKNGLSLGSIRVVEPNLEFLNTQDNTRILADNLDLSVTKLSNSTNGFKIERAALNKPVISVILPKKSTSKEEVRTVEKSTKKDDSNSSKTKLDIGPLKIINATMNFEDKSLPIPFKTTITKLNGKVSEFKNNVSSSTKLEVDGIVDDYGTTKITGIVNPNSIKVLTDINMIFKNIAMKNFTPYSGKFIGRELDSGKLDLDLKYNIEKSNLDAKNNITITKLKLGNKVQSPDAVSLPLDLAIALIQDSNGVIDLNLPISGNVDDPQFSVAPIVFKAFVNLITKALTAPFSLLGAIFGFDENEIKSINFDFGKDEVTPIQKETLDKITKILTKRPNLALNLVPSYDEQKDLEGLQKISFDEIINKKIPNKDNKDYENKYLDLLEDLYSNYEKNIKDLKQKMTKDGQLNTKSYIKALESVIISKQKVEKIQLENIAKNRVINIQKYLVDEKLINKKQILIANEVNVKTLSKKSSDIDLKIKNIK